MSDAQTRWDVPLTDVTLVADRDDVPLPPAIGVILSSHATAAAFLPKGRYLLVVGQEQSVDRTWVIESGRHGQLLARADASTVAQRCANRSAPANPITAEPPGSDEVDDLMRQALSP